MYFTLDTIHLRQIEIKSCVYFKTVNHCFQNFLKQIGFKNTNCHTIQKRVIVCIDCQRKCSVLIRFLSHCLCTKVKCIGNIYSKKKRTAGEVTIKLKLKPLNWYFLAITSAFAGSDVDCAAAEAAAFFAPVCVQKSDG